MWKKVFYIVNFYGLISLKKFSIQKKNFYTKKLSYQKNFWSKKKRSHQKKKKKLIKKLFHLGLIDGNVIDWHTKKRIWKISKGKFCWNIEVLPKDCLPILAPKILSYLQILQRSIL